jgi:predicted MFS family arabinose efflux permease
MDRPDEPGDDEFLLRGRARQTGKPHGYGHTPAMMIRRRSRRYGPTTSRAPLVLFAIILITVLSQFFRASVGVLAPEIIRDLALSPEALGLANAAFFISLTMFQIPVGMLFDSFGVRRTVAALSIVAVLGALLNAVAASAAALVVARLLIGIGCAGHFMAAVVLCARWYGGAEFATVLGRIFAISTSGYLIAGTPWAALAELAGWRLAFVVAAVVAAGITLTFAVVVRDSPDSEPIVRRESLREIVIGLLDVLKIPGLFPIIAVHFFTYAAMLTVLGVWAGPYLDDVFGFDPVARGNVLLAMGLAQMVGVFCYGPLDRRIGGYTVVKAGAVASIAMLLILAAIPHPHVALAVSLLVLFCFVDAFSVLNVADANRRFPPYLAGRGATLFNVSQVLGSSALPVLTGAMVGLFPATAGRLPESAYRAAFLMIAACFGLGLGLYWAGKRREAVQANLIDAERQIN